MAIRTIRIDGDPILSKKSRTVEKFDESLNQLIEDMFETMYEADGVGLAAVQIGILKRLLVMDDYEGTKKVLINPVIESHEGWEPGIEGCLSVPDKNGIVERYKKITVSYQDQEGNPQTLEAEDLVARIIQHEMDHLNGILYTEVATTTDPDETEAFLRAQYAREVPEDGEEKGE
ncbi:MAG: peptide deformylase [Tissierellia bacterium]|nr:peptide deformylase [Tissierellia bacterium]